MDVFTMVVVIVIVGCVTGVASDYLKNKAKYGSNSDGDVDDALDRIEDLEERIRVLEKVVTDDRYELNRQIDSLKD